MFYHYRCFYVAISYLLPSLKVLQPGHCHIFLGFLLYHILLWQPFLLGYCPHNPANILFPCYYNVLLYTTLCVATFSNSRAYTLIKSDAKGWPFKKDTSVSLITVSLLNWMYWEKKTKKLIHHTFSNMLNANINAHPVFLCKSFYSGLTF